MGKKFILLFCLLAATCIAYSQNISIKGIVTDSITGEPLPYVAVLLKGTTIGGTTDLDGKFDITTSSKERTLQISYLGYNEKEIKLVPGKTSQLEIKLAPTTIEITEVVIKPGKEKYTKKDNPAVIFIKNAIERRESNDPKNHDYFSYKQYEKMVFAMNDYEVKPKKEGKKGKFDFLNDFVDTLDVGTTILPVSEREKIQMVYYRKEPKSEKRVVLGSKAAGVDEIFSRDGIQQLLNEVFREVDIFRNDIPLFLNRFVSPMSTMGPNFYKYYLLDTLEIEGQKCVDLGFAPFTPETFGFTGHLYITLDSTYFVQRVKLNVPKKINLNFVGAMTIDQTFKRAADGTRIITKDDISVDFKLSEKSALFFTALLNKLKKRLLSVLVRDVDYMFLTSAVSLPIKNNKIDFAFIDKFIAELEAERLAELEAYLVVTGFRDCELTIEEQKALKEYDEIEWVEITYKSIFNRIEQGRRLKKEDQKKGNIPFVMSGTTNTGVVNFVSNPVAYFPKNSITIDIFGNVFYRNYNFGAGDDTGVYWNDERIYSKEQMIFFAASMRKSLINKFSYGKKLRSSESYNIRTMLPVKSKNVDYDYMNILISAIHKLVIRDVVLYADKKIEATKKAINKSQDYE